MKKIFILLFIFSGSLLFPSASVYAQSTTNATTAVLPAASQLDAKTQKKVDKAIADLTKYRKKLSKEQADFDRAQARFDKKKSKGDLSPNDIEKGQNALDKASKKIEKLEKQIAKNEKYLTSLNIPLPKT